MSGRLVVVGTPIGNLGDLSPRAAEVLRRADVIACEDTRRTGRLFDLAGVERSGRFVVLDDHAPDAVVDELVAVVTSGATVALVSDAGMPGVSDPGERLVAAAHDAGVDVDGVPGPSAALTALVLSGLPAGRFCFEGFLPRRGAARAERLGVVAGESRTTVLFESPHRLAATLVDLRGPAGSDRPVAVARELTKLHQEVWRGSLGEAIEHFADEKVRGEVTIVVGGRSADDTAIADEQIGTALREHLDRGASTRDAVDEVVAATGLSRRRVYDVAKALDR